MSNTVIAPYEIGASLPVAPAGAPRGSGALLQAYRPDGRFGYVTFTNHPTRDAADDEVRRLAATQPKALPGTYDVMHLNHTPAVPFDRVGQEAPVLFVNCMEFPPGGHEAAFALWLQVNAYMVTKPGYRWHRLHRRVDASAPFGLINLVEWESASAWEAAHDAGFRERAVRPQMPFVAYPTVCVPVTSPDVMSAPGEPASA